MNYGYDNRGYPNILKDDIPLNVQDSPPPSTHFSDAPAITEFQNSSLDHSAGSVQQISVEVHHQRITNLPQTSPLTQYPGLATNREFQQSPSNYHAGSVLQIPAEVHSHPNTESYHTSPQTPFSDDFVSTQFQKTTQNYSEGSVHQYPAEVRPTLNPISNIEMATPCPPENNVGPHSSYQVPYVTDPQNSNPQVSNPQAPYSLESFPANTRPAGSLQQEPIVLGSNRQVSYPQERFPMHHHQRVSSRSRARGRRRGKGRSHSKSPFSVITRKSCSIDSRLISFVLP